MLAITTAQRLTVTTDQRLAASNRPADGRHQPPGLAVGEAFAGRNDSLMDTMIREVRLQVHQACEESDYILQCQQRICVCVIGTLCKPLVVQFPCDSWIPVFSRIPSWRRNTKVTTQRKPLRGCDRTIAYLYGTTIVYRPDAEIYKKQAVRTLCTCRWCPVVVDGVPPETFLGLGFDAICVLDPCILLLIWRICALMK